MIEIKYWKDGYIQTGNGNEISIIKRNEDGKLIERIIINEKDLENVIEKLKFCKHPNKLF